MNWKEAFLRQAFSDFEVHEELARLQLPSCHELLYLQMAVEKLGKYYLAPHDGTKPKLTHKSIVKGLKITANNADTRQKLGYPSHKDYQQKLKRINSVAQWLEDLYPTSDDNAPNAKYPWSDVSSAVTAPCDVEFHEQVSMHQLKEFRAFIRSILRAESTD
jgi:hypothetical protein